MLGARSDTGQSDLNWLAHEMWTAQPPSVTEVAEQLRVIVHRRAPDERVFTLLSTEGNWYQWTGLVYFLYEYEAHLTGAKHMAREWGEVRERQKVDSVEHILPQAAVGDSGPDILGKATRSYKGWSERWWQFWMFKSALAAELETIKRVITMAKVSETVQPTLVPSNATFTDKVVVFAFERRRPWCAGAPDSRIAREA